MLQPALAEFKQIYYKQSRAKRSFIQMLKQMIERFLVFPLSAHHFCFLLIYIIQTLQPWSLSLQGNLPQGTSSYFRKIFFLHNREKKHALITQLLLNRNMAVAPPMFSDKGVTSCLPPKHKKA